MTNIGQRKTPKLRTRQQLTIRYDQTMEALNHWHAELDRMGHVSNPFVLASIQSNITKLEAAAEAYVYALNDYVR